MLTSPMIQQQMYTRERRGIFRSTEGYDTIAKSSGLDSNFVKKQLHPLCIYDAPAELAARGEKDEAAYPETMHLLQLDNGDRILGRSVYQAVDFTGLRSAFFTHNYVIPKGSAASDYSTWLRASFVDRYNIEQGTELPELAELPVQGTASAAAGHGYRSVLADIGIGEKAFKQLLYAVMASIGGKKKVYVALDVPIAELPKQAKRLLEVLYASLPYAFRAQLGFVTYSKEAQSRKGVHLTFVERGSLRMGERSTEKDYTFDFASGRIMNADTEGVDQPFLDLAWENLERTDRAEPFFRFAADMLADMEPERALAASSYHELAVLFQIEEGDESLYEAHKSAVLHGMLDYLRPAGAIDSKVRMNDLFMACFDRENDSVRQGLVPESYVAECFRDYYRIGGKYMESKIVTYFVIALNQAIAQRKEDMLASLYEAVESNPLLSQGFFSKVLSDHRLADKLFEPFMKGKFEQAKGVRGVLLLVEQWASAYPELLDSKVFRALASSQLANKLSREHGIVAVAERAFEQLEALERDLVGGRKSGSASFGAAALFRELEQTIYRIMLVELDWNTLTKEQVVQASFLGRGEQLRKWNAELADSRQRSAAQSLAAVYEWFTQSQPAGNLSQLQVLPPAELDRVQQLGQRWLSTELDSSPHAAFDRLIPAFYRSQDMEIIEYAALIDYLRRHVQRKETIYEFFKWSEKHDDFMRPRGFVPAYATAIIAYFKQYDREAFKKSANRKQYFSKAGAVLRKVYEQARQELSSPMAKFFRRNRKAVAISSIMAVAVLLIIYGAVLTFSGKDEPDMGAELPPQVTTTPEAVPETIVYAETTIPPAGGKEATSLVFQFGDAALCTGFSPLDVTIVTPSDETKEYTNVTYAPACEAGVPVAESPDPTDDGKTPASTPSGNAGTVEESAPPSTQQPSESPTPSPSDAAGNHASAEPQTGENGDAVNAALRYNVVVDLGKKVTIPVGSIIRIDAEEYKLSASPQSADKEGQ